MDIEDLMEKISSMMEETEDEGGKRSEAFKKKMTKLAINLEKRKKEKEKKNIPRDEYKLAKSDTAKSGKEQRIDVSERLKELVDELSSSNDLRFATFVGNKGSGRKLFKCPHCEKDMIVAGIRKKKDPNEPKKQPSSSQKEWFKYVKKVGEMPANKHMKRTDVMKIASKLRKEGVPISAL